MGYILALDQGTTSSRAIVFDDAGAIKAVAQKEFRQIFPQPGWVEHDPGRSGPPSSPWRGRPWRAPASSAADVAAIGITNQRETTVVWDRATGEPIANAIVWQDRRTAAACDALRARGLEPRIAQKTGLVLDAYFSATKLAWLLDNVPGARARAAAGGLAFGTVDTWLVWKLSGGAAHVTDREQCLAHAALQHSPAASGTRSCSSCSIFPPPCCRRCALRAGSRRARRTTCCPPASRSPAWRATSRRRCSASAAAGPAWSRTPTAPAASC